MDIGNEITICTGRVYFREIDFSFVLTEGELKLIPPNGMSDVIHYGWFMREIQAGTYVNGEFPIIEEESLTGVCNETGDMILFLPVIGSAISESYNPMKNGLQLLRIKLSAYILCRYNRKMISRITFTGPEIDYIHPVNQGITLTLNYDDIEKGIYKIETNDFLKTTTNEHTFDVKGKNVISKYSIVRSISTNIGRNPLSLNSSLIFEFEPTCDYLFIMQLYRIAKDYIGYLCYRKNIVFEDIRLSAPYKGERYEEFAILHVCCENNEIEEKPLNDKRCILQRDIDSGESRILQDIANNRLYTRHIPTSYEMGRHIDASRFVMITSAFEWEFQRMNPDGLAKSESRRLAEESVSAEIEILIKSKSGKEKEIYKFLKKLIGAASLQSEIVSVCDELEPVIGSVGEYLYSINKMHLDYSEMGRRLADQRNHFAHGDLEKDFIGTSLLDLVFLEYIVYAMQLRYYEIPDENIKKALKRLFHFNIAV